MAKNGSNGKRGAGKRKEVEKELRLSEIKLKELFDNISSGVAVYQVINKGEDFVFVDFNRAAERIEKIKKEDLIGKSIVEVFPGVKNFGLFEVFQRVWKTGNPEYLPVSRYKDERIVGWRENHVYKLPSGEIVAIYDDITERKRAEQALKMSEQCFHAIADYSYFWEIWVNPAGRPVWTNPAVQRVTGYNIKELMALPDYPMPLIYEEDRAKVARAFKSAMKGGRGKEVEFRLLKKDGTVIWVEMSWQPIYDDKGVSIGHRASIRDISERKKARDGLQVTQFCLDHAADSVFWIEPNARLVYVNDAACHTLGYSRQELLSMTVHDIDPNFPQEAWTQHWEEVRRRGSFTFESSHRTKDGSIFPAEITVNYLNYGGKEYNYAFARNITERKEAEDALRSARDDWRNIFESISDAVFILGGDHRVLDANRKAIALLQQPKDEILGRFCYELFHCTDHPPVGCPHEKLLASGQPQTADMEVEILKGIYLVTTTPIFDKEGKIIKILHIARDITDRKRAEEKITALAKFPDENPNPVLRLSDDGTVLYHNKAASELLDIDQCLESGLLLKLLHKYVPRVLKSLEPLQVDTECRDKVYSLTFAPIEDGGYVNVYGLDITHRKQAEQTRDKLNKELESILYAASHDLKSPLVNIQGFGYELSRSCEMIRSALTGKSNDSNTKKAIDSALNKDIPEALDFISSSTSKMDSLLSGLLDLCRLGTAEMTIESVDMNALMADVAANMEYQIKRACAQVENESLPSCLGDASKISRIFTNLLANALKFLDKSRPGLIRISGKSQDGESIYCVEDNGIGIAPEHQEKIFEIFYQLEPDKRKGEGLGLAIVGRILDKHNGKIWVESKVGKGSKFFISLPNA